MISPPRHSPHDQCDAWRTRPLDRRVLESGDLVCTDALEMIQRLRDGIADIIFLDPPFNLGKLYGTSQRSKDQLSESDYFSYMSRLLEACAGTLAEGGALFLYHIPKWAIRFSAALCDLLTFRHWIAISMKNGFARGRRLYPAHYALLYFTKGEPAMFRRPRFRRPAAGTVVN